MILYGIPELTKLNLNKGEGDTKMATMVYIKFYAQNNI